LLLYGRNVIIRTNSKITKPSQQVLIFDTTVMSLDLFPVTNRAKNLLSLSLKVGN